MSKQLDTRIQYKIDSEENWNKSTFISLPGELYFYSTDETHDYTRLKIGDGVQTVEKLPFLAIHSTNDDITEKEIVDKPTGAINEVYSGSTIEPFKDYDFYDKLNLDLCKSISGLQTGTYTAVLVLKDDFIWADTEQASTIITWQISKATLDINIDNSNITFNVANSSTVELPYAIADFEEDYTISSNWSSYSGINVTLNKEIGKITISYTGYYSTDIEKDLILSFIGNNHEGTVTIKVIVEKKKTLETCSWQEINDIAASGAGQSYFSIGESKTIILNGAVGDYCTFEGTIAYAFIIGFDHASDRESATGTTMKANSENTIDFQLCKSIDTINNSRRFEIFVDSAYGFIQDTSKNCFKMRAADDTADSTYYYWEMCFMRHNILGSSCNDPEDASAGTFIKSLPQELRNVLCRMYIGTGDENSLGLTNYCYDYLPLPGVYELCNASSVGLGTANGPIGNDKAYQRMYEYYELGNSCTDNEGRSYWTRSRGQSYNQLEGTDPNLNVVVDDSVWRMPGISYSYGISPIFRVGQKNEPS